MNRVSRALRGIEDKCAADYLAEYYGLDGHGAAFTGSWFDRFAPTPRNRLTAEDFVAVSCLSVHVPARAAVALLGRRRDEVSDLLAQIPAELPLESVKFERYEECFGEGSAILELWRLLRSTDKPWGVGPTTASKIMARKRPSLIPIYDTKVAEVTGFADDRGTWRAWHEALSDDESLVTKLRTLRLNSSLDHLSLLRVLDVVLWMHGSRSATGPALVGGRPTVSEVSRAPS